MNTNDSLVFYSLKNVRSCEHERYEAFLDYAFSTSNIFMLVYVNYYGKGYAKMQREIKDKLTPYKLCSRRTPFWPGTQGTYSKGSTYRVVFYRTDEAAKSNLNRVSAIDMWSCPDYPEDLAFYRGSRCWFSSTGHESLAALTFATKEDIDFFKQLGMISERSARVISESYSAQFHEKILKKYDDSET